MFENEKNRKSNVKENLFSKHLCSGWGFVSLDRSLNVVGISDLHFWELTIACLCVHNTQQNTVCVLTACWRGGICTFPTPFRAGYGDSQTISEMVLQIWVLYNSVTEKTHFKQFIATVETNFAPEFSNQGLHVIKMSGSRPELPCTVNKTQEESQIASLTSARWT